MYHILLLCMFSCTLWASDTPHVIPSYSHLTRDAIHHKTEDICHKAIQQYNVLQPRMVWDQSISDIYIHVDNNTIILPDRHKTFHIFPHVALFCAYAYTHRKGIRIFSQDIEQELRILEGIYKTKNTANHIDAYHTHAIYYNDYPAFTYAGLHHITSTHISHKLLSRYIRVHNISQNTYKNYESVHREIDMIS